MISPDEDRRLKASWLPDSRHLVYGTAKQIFIADTETRQTRELVASLTESIRSPFVSRDGKLLYYATVSSENDIWLLDLSQSQ